jgi:uncharacterized protein YcbK (DUF882 family)
MGGEPLPSTNLLTRRRVIGAAAVATGLAFTRTAPAVSFAPRSVSLYNTHTGEWLRTVYWADGHYIRDAVKEINWILRDHYTNEVRPMNAGVLDVIGLLRHRLESNRPFQIVCGYRTPATNARLYEHRAGVASNSYHIHGMAVDLRAEGRDVDQVYNAALSVRGGGVGYYPESNFVHVDCGPIRTW